MWRPDRGEGQVGRVWGGDSLRDELLSEREEGEEEEEETRGEVFEQRKWKGVMRMALGHILSHLRDLGQ